ncbi:LacI family transcriptional regulator [Ktedonosporobacter rubrisoli]|uniref:LacI family transcriptional regulator n=1 Tax=Ktedonosporobacter rubrisoli TaxID=2509675 RepID=A0A4P6JN54_KTERU|nr:LacI family DNA-binding transcriptional regulator [Ktedonosporobacter rubrisoli]QBD76737.1 LacI family transcriptional regulator [Ktedonosporobacter rubrisoli]
MHTIHDVAKAAGVSITTVSRALNGHSDVGEKTRQRIISIAKELDYQPNAAARNLRTKRTDSIALAPGLPPAEEANLFFKQFIGTLAFDCFQHNLSLLVTLPYLQADATKTYQQLARTSRVDGIILASIQPQDQRIALLQSMDMPFVAFGRLRAENDLTYPFVDVDGKMAIRKIVDYLYGQGHRRIAYLSDLLDASYIYYRRDGYLEALQAHNLSEDPRLIIMGLHSQQETTQALESLFGLSAESIPTAIVTSNDRLAMYVLSALRMQGRAVGKGAGQIALASFDDLPFAAYIQPSLTTIHPPLEELSKLLLELLVSILKQEELNIQEAIYPHATRLGPQQFLLEPDLIIRDSA